MPTNQIFGGTKFSENYAQYRPSYPQEVLTIILSYMKNGATSDGYSRALDVACGAGQSTFLLNGSFEKVIGLDVSKTQIEQANKVKEASNVTNVEFIVGDAHSLPVESSSIDLLTCAMGWHWLNPELFYSETKRVLRPGGCVAVYGYGVRVEDNEHVRKAFDTFHAELFKYECFSEQNLHVLDNYQAVNLPFENVKRVDFPFPQTVPFNNLLGLFSSVSMYKSYSEKYPDNTLLERMKADYETNEDRVATEKFTFPGFVILGVNK